MKIKCTLEDTSLFDLMVQHLAEKTEQGNISEWAWGLIYREISSHPDYRFCAVCEETFYPVFQTREIIGIQRKHYRIDIVGAIETCRKCGGGTIPFFERTPDDGFELARAARNRRYVAGEGPDTIFGDADPRE